MNMTRVSQMAKYIADAKVRKAAIDCGVSTAKLAAVLLEWSADGGPAPLDSVAATLVAHGIAKIEDAKLVLADPPKKKTKSYDAEAKAVADYWAAKAPGSKALEARHLTAIKTRLRTHAVDDLKAAIDGYVGDSWATTKLGYDILKIVSSAEKADSWLAKGLASRPKKVAERRNEDLFYLLNETLPLGAEPVTDRDVDLILKSMSEPEVRLAVSKIVAAQSRYHLLKALGVENE
jgi:hypothetical protein